MPKFGKKKLIVGAVAAAVIAGGAGAAYAYWTTSGTGNGSATTGTSTNYDVTVDAPTGGALSPGGAVDHVPFTVKNVGSGYQNVTTASAVVANTDGTAWTSVAGCSAGDYAISNVSITSANLAPNGTTTGSFDITMTDTGQNQNGCKGATVPLHVTVG